MADITGLVNSVGVQLEQNALNQFGAAIQNVVGNTPLRDVFVTSLGSETGSGSNPTNQEAGVYDTTRYAAALVRPDQVEFNPKLKFLFKVSFKFDPEMLDAARVMGYDLSTIEQNASFMVRHVDRPKIDYDYEDVNLYNFRTKVLKQIKHREVGLTLYDDVGNNVLSFINAYRKLQMPIARMQVNPSLNHEDFGMEFDKTFQATDTGMRSVLPGDRRNILQKMTIHQIFVERGSTNSQASSWVKTVDFVFINPRFTNIDIDDMDHENGSNFNLITCTVDFDTMFMDESKPFTQNLAPSFPGGDITADGERGATNAQGATRNPFVDIVANQTQRSTTTGVSSLINRTLTTSAGGAIFSGGVSGITSLIQDQARRTLGSMAAGITQGFSARRQPLIIDDSVVSSEIPDLSSQESSRLDGDFGFDNDTFA